MIYEVYFEGTLEVQSDVDLSEEEVFDEAYDIMCGDARTRLNSGFSPQFEIIDAKAEE